MTDPKPPKIDIAEARAHLEQVFDDHEQAFERFFLARFLDLGFAYLPETAGAADKTGCEIRFPVTDRIMNPQGVVHGGVLATVMDISMGHLVAKVAGPAATIEMKVQYMRPLTDGPARCIGSFTKRGRSLSFMESRVFDAQERLVAQASATWKMPAGAA
ncbi:PaaI family thioesterase [Dinoroseobacter sp. S124A]|uniref:PaaI family thioesterase n=1 Tax=Dinoroseobacter sp. S124A TaxID=3415128 RepID=UPI003C7E3AD8